MIELIPKKYRLTIEFFGKKDKPIEIHFDYEEGSLKELLEMQQRISDADSMRKWLYDFLMNKCKQSAKLTEELYAQLWPEKITQFVGHIMRTYGDGFFAKKGEKVKKSKSPSSAFIASILSNTNETLESVLNMKWSQIDYLTEGIVWNINEQNGKKGKMKNEQYLRIKESKKGKADNKEKKSLKALDKIMKFKNLKK